MIQNAETQRNYIISKQTGFLSFGKATSLGEGKL